MTETKVRPAPIVLASAAAVAVAIGAVGVYVFGDAVGNGPAGTCAASEAVAERLKPLAAGELAALIVAEEPADLSALGFQTTDGAPVTLADFKGRGVLLNLWATWCAPCREEMPALDRLQAEAGGDRFAVVTVNVDVGDPRKPAAFLAEAGIAHLPDFRDPKMKIFNDLKAKGLAFGMPTTLLLDPAGCQVAALHGPAVWDSPAAVSAARVLGGGA